METRTRRLVVGVLVLAGLLAAGYVGLRYFAPKPETHVDQAPEAGLTAVRTGTFRDGAPAHQVSGAVTLLRASDGTYSLRFEDYDATAGPDVYLYLTPKAGASSTADVEGAGVRILVPGGADGGEATLRGNFNVPLPEGVDPTAYAGLAVWCERFDVLFGHAPLV